MVFTQPPFDAQDGIRTHTEVILSHPTLPVGLQGPIGVTGLEPAVSCSQSKRHSH